MLGPSGCGKTTTLRMIAGFEAPDAGRILLQGNDVTYVPPAKRNVNMVFQAYGLFPHMTVAENIAFGPKIKKLGPDGDRIAPAGRDPDRAARRARGPATEPAVGRPAAAGGARPRAREPAGGAAAGRAARRARSQAAQGDAAGAEGAPAAHRHDVRLRHARPGGSDDDERPHRRDERRGGGAAGDTARAVPAPGQRLRGGVHRNVEPDRAAGRSTRRPSCWRWTSATNSASSPWIRRDGQHRDRATITVRPEWIKLANGAAGDRASYVGGTVVDVVYLGSITQLIVLLQTGERLTVHRLNDEVGAIDPRPGEQVMLRWAAEHSYIVGSASRRRIRRDVGRETRKGRSDGHRDRLHDGGADRRRRQAVHDVRLARAVQGGAARDRPRRGRLHVRGRRAAVARLQLPADGGEHRPRRQARDRRDRAAGREAAVPVAVPRVRGARGARQASGRPVAG